MFFKHFIVAQVVMLAVTIFHAVIGENTTAVVVFALAGFVVLLSSFDLKGLAGTAVFTLGMGTFYIPISTYLFGESFTVSLFVSFIGALLGYMAEKKGVILGEAPTAC